MNDKTYKQSSDKTYVRMDRQRQTFAERLVVNVLTPLEYMLYKITPDILAYEEKWLPFRELVEKKCEEYEVILRVQEEADCIPPWLRKYASRTPCGRIMLACADLRKRLES